MQEQNNASREPLPGADPNILSLLSNLPGMAYRCKNVRNRTMDFISQGCENLTGYAAEEIIRDNKIAYNRLIHPDDREMVWNTIQENLKEGSHFELEYRIITRDKNEKWVWERGQRIYQGRGGRTVLEGFISDISNRKLTEESLKKNEEFQRSLIAISPVSIHGIDAESKIIIWNESSEKIFGWKEKEVLGKVLPIVPEDKMDEHLDLRKRVASGETISNVEVIRLKKDKTRFYGKLSASPIFNNSGTVIGIVAVMEDITTQKKAEEALRKSEENYRTLFETMTLGVVYQDASGKIISANPAAEQILGLTLDQLQGRTSISKHWKSIHKDGSEFPGEAHPSMIALKTGKKISNVTMGIINPKRDQYTWININAIPIFKKAGKKPDKVYTIFEDITNRMQMEKELDNHKTHLEDLVSERTSELEEKNRQLARFNKLFVGREIRIKELRNKVHTLEEQLREIKDDL